MYTDFLVSQYHQDNLQEIVEPIERPRLAGSLNGTYSILHLIPLTYLMPKSSTIRL